MSKSEFDVNTSEIMAAGAVLYRINQDEIEIGLIHRPRYDDWSFPKGKIEFGESFLAAAHREVFEETGYAAKFGPLIAEIQYLAEGVPKRVKYWAAHAISAAKPITDLQEVDEFEWHSLKSAKAKLTHEEDRKVLKMFKEISPGIDQNSTLILLRHAKALKRVEWIGDDGDRPLDNRGQIQSEKFRSIYEAYEIDEIFSSDAYRCLETVKPLGRDLGIAVGIASDISEYQYSRDKEKPLKFAKKFLKASKDSETPKTVLLCSHNPVLPKILKELAGAMAVDEIDRGLEPGDGWVLFHRDGKVRAINFISAP
jgi:8-oxo-dGTP diphosphatase